MKIFCRTKNVIEIYIIYYTYTYNLYSYIYNIYSYIVTSIARKDNIVVFGVPRAALQLSTCLHKLNTRSKLFNFR